MITAENCKIYGRKHSRGSPKHLAGLIMHTVTMFHAQNGAYVSMFWSLWFGIFDSYLAVKYVTFGSEHRKLVDNLVTTLSQVCCDHKMVKRRS